MTEENNEEEKRQLQKLLREYDANKGMAGLVCSRPVELMPETEQDRLINGFCTPQNLHILTGSKIKLMQAKELPYAEEADREKIEKAIAILETLIPAFSAYMNSQLDKKSLRKKVRQILHRPIPDSEEGLTKALSHLVETVSFLGEEPLNTKDSWDKMVDCVQMHDALSRTRDVCTALQSNQSKDTRKSSLIVETISVAKDNVDHLEQFFAGKVEGNDLQERFGMVKESLNNLWQK